MLQVKDLSISMKKKEILKGINCDFEKGVHGLLGPNGAGKTTFMRSILGLYPQAKGEALINGKSLQQVNVGYLPQKFGLFPNMTIRQALTYIGNLKKIPNEKLQQQIEQLIEDVALGDKIDCKMSTLSGGMIRRVGIAQAFLGEPDVIVLDEPTAGLDPEERIRFKNYIKANRKDYIIIISTHIVDDVEYLCDYVEVMKSGNIVIQENCENIAHHAMGKVYGVTEGSLASMSVPYYLIKEYDESGHKKLRILVDDQIQGDELSPTLEDGYLCVLREN